MIRAKYLSLLLLTIHNAATVLLMRYSRTREAQSFLTTSTVLASEFVKLLTCLVVILLGNKCQVKLTVEEIHTEIIRKPLETLKVGLPAVLYAVQNNLVFVAVSNLDAATYQVTYQLRIFTTAVLSVILLSTQLSRFQWLALIQLVVGVSIVQISIISNDETTADTARNKESYALGIASISVASLLSGFATVYFEKFLKATDVSIWVRNVQLAGLSIPVAFCGVLLTNFQEVKNSGFFHGFDSLVWTIVMLQSAGGLLIAVVVKYTDSIMKGFSMSASVVLSVALSDVVSSTALTPAFCLGAFLVILAVYIYTANPVTEKAQPKEIVT